MLVMAPKLYGDIRSPCVRAVLLTAKALNLDLEYITVDVIKGEHLEPGYLKINPRHTVPSLDDDGFLLWDSHSIMIYLAQKYGKNNSIYPEDLKKRSLINQMLFFETGDIFAIHRFISLQVIHKGLKEAPEAPLVVLEKSYEYVETFLKGTKYIAGNEMTIADFSFWTTLSNSSVWVPIDEKKYPKIANWIKVMKSLSYKECNEVGKQEFLKLIESVLKK